MRAKAALLKNDKSGGVLVERVVLNALGTGLGDKPFHLVEISI